jgi:hypothetical protein
MELDYKYPRIICHLGSTKKLFKRVERIRAQREAEKKAKADKLDDQQTKS